MERRTKTRWRKRVAVSVDGKPAMLMNISLEGLQVNMTGMPASPQVKVTIQAGDIIINVEGKVMWVKKSSFLYQPNLFGISITTSSPEYVQLVSRQQFPC